MNQGYSMYNQVDVNTSNPVKIVMMLYDGAINFINKSIENANNGDIKNKCIYANKARDIIVELNNSLDMETGGDVSKNLRNLYNFMNRHLMQSNWKNDTKGFKEVIHILSQLKDGWQDVMDENAGSRAPLPRQPLRISV